MKTIKITAAEIVDITCIKEHPKNYRKHGEDQLAHIIASVKAHGVYKNVVVSSDNVILGGHGVVEACRKLAIKKIPIVRLSIKSTDKRALKILTGDNEISKLAEVDDRLLSEILKDVAIDVDGLLGTGFDDKMLANLVYVTRHADEIKDFDAAKEWVGLPSYDEKDDTKDKQPIIEISFNNEKDREAFVKKFDIKIKDTRGGRKWSTIWPFQERNDLKSVKFEAKKK